MCIVLWTMSVLTYPPYTFELVKTMHNIVYICVAGLNIAHSVSACLENPRFMVRATISFLPLLVVRI